MKTSTSTPSHSKTKPKVPPRKKSTVVTPTRDDMTVPPVDSDSEVELYQIQEADHITHSDVSAPAQEESASQEPETPPVQELPPTEQPVQPELDPQSIPTSDADEESVASSTDDDQPAAVTAQTTEHEEDALQLDEPDTSDSVPATTTVICQSMFPTKIGDHRLPGSRRNQSG